MKADAASSNHAAVRWLESLTAAGRSDATVKRHRRSLNTLFQYVQVHGGGAPEQIDFRKLVPVHVNGAFLGLGPVNPLFVERFLAWACTPVTDPEQAARLRNDLLETLHMFFRTLVAADVLDEDPTLGVPRARVRVRVNHRKYLTPAESAQLLDAAARSGERAARNFTLLLLMLRTGIRPGEACGLQVQDVDLASGLLHVTGKTGPRVTPLVPAVQEVLHRYLLGPSTKRPGVLFTNDAGDGPLTATGLRRIIQDLCAMAGVDRGVTTYWLRHTFATDAYRAGVAFPIVSQALGHAKISTTYTYVHGRESRMRRIVEDGPASLPFEDVQRSLLRAVDGREQRGLATDDSAPIA